MPNVQDDDGGSPRARRLARIVDMLAAAPGVRAELVDDIRAQLDGGGYVNEEKLELAIGRMLREILR